MTPSGQSVTETHRPSYPNDERFTVRMQPDAIEAMKRGFDCRFIQLHQAPDGEWDLYVEFDEPSHFGVAAPDDTPRSDGKRVGDPR